MREYINVCSPVKRPGNFFMGISNQRHQRNALNYSDRTHVIGFAKTNRTVSLHWNQLFYTSIYEKDITYKKMIFILYEINIVSNRIICYYINR